MRRVLIIRFSALGDIVLTFPGLDRLAEDGYEVHFLTKESFKALIELQGRASQIHTVPDHATFAELLAVLRGLRGFRYERVYDFHRNLRSRIACLALGRPFFRVRKFRFREWLLYIFRRAGYRALFEAPIPRSREAYELAGGTSWPRQGQVIHAVDVLPASVRAWLSREPKRSYICIAAESAWTQKEWGQERFVEVARRLTERGFGVVWLGLRPVPPDAIMPEALDLTRKLSLGEVAAVLQNAKALLCNDSGLMHFSEAVGTPVCAIFGPTSQELGFGPRLKGSRVVEADLWCRPCSKTGRWCLRPVDRWGCLRAVTVDAVMGSLAEVISMHGHEVELNGKGVK